MKATINRKEPTKAPIQLEQGHWYWLGRNQLDLYLCVRTGVDQYTLVSAADGHWWAGPYKSLEALSEFLSENLDTGELPTLRIVPATKVTIEAS